MTKLRTSAIALVLAASTAAGVTGCSKKEAPKAKDAWNTAQDTLGTYKSLKMTAKGTDEGKPVEMTIEGTVDGKTQHITGKQGNGTFDMITVGGKSYMKGNSAYFDESSSKSSTESDKAMSKAMADKWIEMPADSSEDSELALTKSLIKDMRDDSDDDSKKLLSDKATVTEDSVDGKDAWKITSEDKKLNVWVSQDDKRDLLKASGMEGSKKDSMSEMTFSDANTSFDIKAPSGAKSITDLMGG